MGDQVKILKEIIDEVRQEQQKYSVGTAEWKTCNDAILRLSSALQEAYEAEARIEEKKIKMELDQDNQVNEVKRLQISEANRDEDHKWDKVKFWTELGITLLGAGINIIPVLLCFWKEDVRGEIVTGKKVNFLPKVLFTRFRFLK